MTLNDHPQYPNNTIVEALCEFRITLSPEKPWKPGLPVGLISRLSNDFPQVEPIAEFGFEVTIGPQGPAQKVVQAPPKFRFSNAENNRLIQIAPALCVFNVLRPYRGWSDMQSMIRSNWPKICEVIEPISVDRVGLRYINRIPTPQGSVIKDWLQATRYIPNGLIDSFSPMSARIEAKPTKDCQISVTVAHIEPAPNELPGILYDIDCIRLSRLSTQIYEIEPIMKDMHDVVWNEFKSAQTPRFERFLRGETE